VIDGINTYCINLDIRPDRWAVVQGEADKIGVKPTRFPAVYRKRGHDGCKASHMALLQQVKDEGVFMVIEDDMKIIADDPISATLRAYDQLPSDWDMFYLGATLTVPLKRYSENLFRLKTAWATQAIIYNNQNGVVDYILRNHNQNKFSVFLGYVVQEKFNCYITDPLIATQQAGRSDILKKRVSYAVIEKNYDKYTRDGAS